MEEIGLLLTRKCADHPNVSTLSGNHRDRVPRRPSDWILKALEEVAIGCDSEATIAFVIGRQYTEAATLAISSLRKLMRVPLDLSHAEKRMLRGMKVGWNRTPLGYSPSRYFVFLFSMTLNRFTSNLSHRSFIS